jgi:hypothetical protein
MFIKNSVGAGNFSLHHRFQNSFEAHPASYPTGTSGSFPGGSAAGTWCWLLTSIQCRGQRLRVTIRPLPQYAFMAWCSVKKAKGQLYLYFCILLLSLAPQPSLGLGLLHKIRLNFLEASQQFSLLQDRVVSPTPNPHPGGPGLCIYIPQRQGGYPF